MCLHVPRDEGRRGRKRRTGEDRVNAQFVFRSAEKTRSLQRAAAVATDPRRQRPRVVAVVVVGSHPPSLGGFIFMTTSRATRGNTNCERDVLISRYRDRDDL